MSEFDQHPNITNAESKSPEELAQQIFNSPPKKICSICILPFSNQYDNDAISFNFEILLTIYLEGLMNILEVLKKNYLQENSECKDKKSYEVENIIYNTAISIDDLKFPEPWFNSFGYSIQVTEYSSSDNLIHKIKQLSYCKILLSFDPKDRINFLMKDIKTKYHFILNKLYKPTNDLTKIYTLLIKNNIVYKISFKSIEN